jgi:hypothetical protein
MLLITVFQLQAQTGDYKNSRTFFASTNFVVPKGVTLLKVEIWGAGGGGSPFGGGGGGAYGRAILNVAEFSTLQIIVGRGGMGGTESGNNGTATVVRFNPMFNPTAVHSFTANPGKASVYYSSVVSAGEGGDAAFISPNETGFYFESGADGEVYQDSYRQNGTVTVTTRRYGRR